MFHGPKHYVFPLNEAFHFSLFCAHFRETIALCVKLPIIVIIFVYDRFMSTICLDLKSCVTQLQYSIGAAAPAYVTLRRWADQGKLRSAERPGQGSSKRMLYSVRAIEKIVLSKTLPRNPKPSSDRLDAETNSGNLVVNASSSEINSRLDLIEDGMAIVVAKLEHMIAKLEQLEKPVKECGTGVQNLEAVRRTMMLKYEAQNSSYVETIADLKSRLKTTTRGDDGSHELALMRAQLSRLTDSVNQFLSQ